VEESFIRDKKTLKRFLPSHKLSRSLAATIKAVVAAAVAVVVNKPCKTLI